MNVLLKPIMRLLYARMFATLDLTPQPTDAPQAHGSGPNPDRVLVFGSGAAAGFGVVSHQLALPGRLADELSQITGRGTDVDVKIFKKRSIVTVIKAITDQELRKYDAIVVTLGTRDAFALTNPRRWSASVSMLLQTISEASPVSTPIVLTGIHPIHSAARPISPLSGLVDLHARKLNLIAEQICVRSDRASFVPLIAPKHTQEDRHRTSGAYAQWARLIAMHMAPRVPVAGWSDPTGEHTARQLRRQPQSTAKRQRALSDLAIMETGPEECFDRVVTLARAYFDTHFAAFILSDGNREWFKSKVGFRGTPNLEMLSAETINTGGPLVVGNARTDDRFRFSTLAGGLGIGFYAGYPVEAPDGHRIGVLSVFDQNPRKTRTTDSIMLRDLAMMLQRELWNRVE